MARVNLAIATYFSDDGLVGLRLGGYGNIVQAKAQSLVMIRQLQPTR